MEPQYRPVDLAALVADAPSRASTRSTDRAGPRSTSQPAVLSADPPKLERIVENLVTNAARHTPPGSCIWVRVVAAATGRPSSSTTTGQACLPSLQDAIFEPFRQGPTASSHAPGTGIGLSLVARFAELHGGRAWVEDRDGGGAAFRVFIPAGPARRAPDRRPGRRAAPEAATAAGLIRA